MAKRYVDDYDDEEIRPRKKSSGKGGSSSGRKSSGKKKSGIQPASSLDKISITTETFRDKVTPGDSETLTFKVRGMNGASPESAVILDMSNKAIDVLNPNPLNFVPAGFSKLQIECGGSGINH